MIFFFTTILFSFILFLFYHQFSKIYNVFDYPDFDRKIHKVPVSLLGGFFLFLNLFSLFLIDFFNFFENLNLFYTDKEFLFLTFGAICFFLVGYFDDKKSINPNLKLILTIIIVLISLVLDDNLLLKKLKFSFFSEDINFNFFNYFLTILCFALFINALNMLDGINCQVASYVSFILIIFIIKGILIYLSFLLLISVLTFLILNYQNKIYFGDSGTLLLGFIISYFFLKTYNVQNAFYADEIFLIMSIPGYELLRLFLKRILLKKNPFKSDQNHIHHLLLKKFGYAGTFISVQSVLFFPYLLFNITNNFFVSLFFSIFLYTTIIIKFSKNNNAKS
jgi:UDP-GlcNAc:undecaprenyl-phosphate GlcNAc-1-phosphate transferase